MPLCGGPSRSRAGRPTGSTAMTPPSAGMYRPAGRAASIPPVLAPHLALDVLLGDLRPPEDVPCVHQHSDAPPADGEHRPEEPVSVGDRPDHDEEGVDQDIDENMTVKVTPLLELPHRPVAGCLLTCISCHDRPSP